MFGLGVLLVVGGLVSLIAGVVMKGSSKGSSQDDYGRHDSRAPQSIGFGAVAGGLAAMLIGVVFIVVSGLYRQDPGEAKVIRNFGGGISHIDTTAGLDFKAPWKSIVTYNVRNQKIEMFGGANTGNPNLGSDGAAIIAPLKGSANAYVSVTVAYSIIPDKVAEIYTVFRDQGRLLETKLKPNLRDAVRVESSKFEPFQIKEQRADLSAAVLKALEAKWRPIGVTIDDINLGDVRLDPKTEAAIEKINEAKANLEAQRTNQITAEIEAEKKRIIAKGDTDSDQIIRCGARTVTVTEEVGGKPTKVTKVIPKTNRECENRLNEQVLTARWLETLEALGAKGNVTIVVPNTPSGGVNPRIDLPLKTAKAKP